MKIFLTLALVALFQNSYAGEYKVALCEESGQLENLTFASYKEREVRLFHFNFATYQLSEEEVFKGRINFDKIKEESGREALIIRYVEPFKNARRLRLLYCNLDPCGDTIELNLGPYGSCKK